MNHQAPTQEPSLARIVVQHIFTQDLSAKTSRYEQLWRELDQYVAGLTPPGTLLDTRYLDRTTCDVYSPLSKHKNDLEVATACIRAATTADAIAVACFADPAVQFVRSEISVPVVGACQASLAVARDHGSSYGIVVVAEPVVNQVTRNLRMWGEHTWAAPDRPIRALNHWNYDHLVEGLLSENDILIDSFHQTARQLIAAGADVILAGCAYLAAMLTRRGCFDVDGTPVVDSFASAIHHATTLHRLRDLPRRAQPHHGGGSAEHN